MPYRKQSPETGSDQMIYGIRPVLEALDAGREIERIFIHTGAGSPLMEELKTALRERRIRYQDVPLDKLNSLTRKNHQDVVCFISPISYQRLHQVIPAAYEQGRIPLVVLLDRITDVRNFGAIARTAECAGADALVIPFRGAAQINADALKTSAGALHNIAVCREQSLEEAVGFLKDSGLRAVAVSEKGKKFPDECDLQSPLALVMGSEENGIGAGLLKLCDESVRIPMLGKTSSLNVSVACGIVLFEAGRQRRSS